MNSKNQQYTEYMKAHIEAINDGYHWLTTYLPNIFTYEDIDYAPSIYINIQDHDKSKYFNDEWIPYREYFYGERTPEVEEAFDYAWLAHIHNNEHHWQYWVLLEDNEGVYKPKALDIPYEFIIEMILDWWSFSWKTGNLYEIFTWYENHKDKILLSANTKKIVEDILGKIFNKLNETTN